MTADRLPTDEEIYAAASEFRAALNAIDRAYWERIQIRNFPRGACGHCAELLARHLNDRFGIVADYVSCNLDSGDGALEHGHAWLEWSGLLIDISGDQFGWSPVIVTRSPGYEHAHSRLNTRHPWKLEADWWSRQCAALWQEAQLLMRRRMAAQ